MGPERTEHEPGTKDGDRPADTPVGRSVTLPWAAIGVIFVGALLVRGVALVDLSFHDPWFDSPVVDERTNVEDARRIVREGIRIETPYWKPPLYPHLLSIPIALGLGSERSDPGPEPGLAWTMKILQALLDSWTAVLVATIAARIARRPRAALWAGGLHALGFLPVFYTAQFLDTTLYTFLVVATVRFALAAAEDRAVLSWMSAGILAGLAAITRATMLATIPVLALVPWWTGRGPERGGADGARWRWLAGGALVVLGAAAMILPVTLMNARFGGDRVLISSNGGINFYIGNRPGGGVGSDGLTSVHAGPRWDDLLRETAHIQRPSERSSHYYRIAWRAIADDPGHFVGRIATKVHALVHSFDVPNNKNFAEERERSPALRYLPARSGVVIPLALVGLACSGVLLTRRFVLVGTLASQASIAVVFFVAARYRVPLLALGSVPAGALLAEVFERTAPVQRRRILAVASILLAALLAWDPHGWRERFEDYVIDPVALGAALDNAGDDAGARRWYERALRLDPDHAVAEYQIGHLELAAGRLDAAEARFRKSVETDPGFALGWNAIGTLALSDGRPDEAAASFLRAIEEDPTYGPARSMYGQMLESSGRVADARVQYEEARRSDPSRPLYWLLEARALWRLHRPDGTRTLLTQLAAMETRPLDEREEKLRAEIVEDLKLWPDGPPLDLPTEPGEDEQPPGEG